jgi:hypothetical protein
MNTFQNITITVYFWSNNMTEVLKLFKLVDSLPIESDYDGLDLEKIDNLKISTHQPYSTWTNLNIPINLWLKYNHFANMAKRKELTNNH